MVWLKSEGDDRLETLQVLTIGRSTVHYGPWCVPSAFDTMVGRPEIYWLLPKVSLVEVIL